MNEAKRFSTTVGRDTITIETGKLANQASGAVTVRLGDTLILTTATMAKTPREGIDFFPLSVEYEERLYAAGRIPGSFFRREGRPGEASILVCRLTDRPLRPLFPDDFRNDVQVVITSLSSDSEHQVDILAINGASAALTISDIPFQGPVAAVRVGYIDGAFVVNPTWTEMVSSTLDLRIAGTKDAILMVECGASELPEALMVEALDFGHQALQPLIDLQNQMREALGKPKNETYPKFAVPAEVTAAVREKIGGAPSVAAIFEKGGKKAQIYDALDELQAATVAALKDTVESKLVSSVFHDLEAEVVRSRILDRGVRPDGRGLTQIRPLEAEVDFSPRAHGSGLFTRGETQVLSIATLGTLKDKQELDGLDVNDSKRYLHHYNFPPYSTGEAKPMRGSSRREIGHGALAERALIPVLPTEQEFPYTIRVVSEVMSSNGSTSMASVCGSTLALMDAGVPITAPVAGIAMGLISDGSRFAILTDIQGMEDHLGDMDFKVAGTSQGITALQMDIKIKGLSKAIMEQALAQAHAARMIILDVIKNALAEPRPQLKEHAPRITTVHINPEKIGALIGPGGKNVRGIQDDTGATIDIHEDGTVYIAATNGVMAEAARARVEGLTDSVEIGKIYTGKVVRITDFGAFVEILPGTDGMVHISQLADYRAPTVESVVKLGDEVMVMVTDVDAGGKIRLSRRAVLEGLTPEQAREMDKPRSSSGGDRSRSGGGDRRSSGGNRGGSGDRNRR
jgi:polyribonucleotide nucleotidyltransferase